jgi:hypothetical protein
VLVYAVIDDSLSPTSPLGDALEVYVRCEELSASSRRSEATILRLARPLRIEEREHEAGGVN